MKESVSKQDKVLAWTGLLVLLLFHIDFWRPQRPNLYFGWLPEEMAYRLIWMVAAGFYLWFFTRRIWKGDS